MQLEEQRELILSPQIRFVVAGREGVPFGVSLTFVIIVHISLC
jgi:hypothetical protein